jgi:hypothetical protein
VLRDKHRLSVFENGMLRILEPKRGEVTGGWEKLDNENFIICTLHKILFG